MYAKIFDQIYDGSLADNWQALVSFQQLLILKDSDGVVDLSVAALSRRTGIPREIFEVGIPILESPDPESRSSAEDGRRIVRIDPDRSWGWKVVNHAFYRNLASRDDKKDADRRRMAAKREEKDKQNQQCRDESQGVADGRGESPEVAEVAHANTDTVLGTNVPLSESKIPPCPHLQIIRLYHAELPELPSILESSWSRSKEADALRARWNEDSRHQDVEFWRDLFGVVRSNPHWMGNNDRGWRASLRWLVKKENFIKVCEWGVNHG